MSTALVIGAGVGGLASAAQLARAGYRVTVLEKNDHAGGRMDRIVQDGFYFDVGPTLFLMPQIYAETFAALGERMEDHLELERLVPNYRVHFHDGTTLDLTPDLQPMRQKLEDLKPGSFQPFLRFMAEGCRHFELALERFVGRNFYTFWDMFQPKNLPLLLQLRALQKHAARTWRFFHDPKLLAAFSFQNMYLGLSPYDAPATYSLLQYTELADGIWLPKGGMYRFVEAMTRIAEGLGVRLRYGAPVARINIEGNRATGVTLADGERLGADVIVANADLPYVYAQLLPDDGSAAKLARKRYTSSTLMFYWGIKGERSAALLHHNVFLSEQRYRASFERIFRDLTLPDEPSFYVRAATRTDPALAPADGDSLFILVPVGHINEDHPQDYGPLWQRARAWVLQRLAAAGLADLERRIVFEARIGPYEWRERYNLAKGSAFGLSHNITQVGYLRPHNRHPRYGNLYFAGASTHPGTGVPIVLLSARLVVERILREQGTPQRTVMPVERGR